VKPTSSICSISWGPNYPGKAARHTERRKHTAKCIRKAKEEKKEAEWRGDGDDTQRACSTMTRLSPEELALTVQKLELSQEAA